MLSNHAEIVSRLRELQRRIQLKVLASRSQTELHRVHRQTQADTLYALDLQVEGVVVEYCEGWGRTTPLVVVAEGIDPETGRVFPAGAAEGDARLRLLLDPIDGTRGLMYDKRSGWSLAGVAANKGPSSRLREIEVAVMTELPTSKMNQADVLWAVRGQGIHAERLDLATGEASPLAVQPSKVNTLAHGFACIANFFPGTKRLAAELMEFLVAELGLAGLGGLDGATPLVFDDQYLATSGQFYELAVGHDRFIADLRPLFARVQGQPPGLCVHPYDLAAMLIAEEAGVLLTDGRGQPLDAPFDVHTPLSWIGYANGDLRRTIEPLIQRFLRDHGLPGP